MEAQGKWEEYLDATSLHGFAYLQKSYSTCARLFWSFMVVAGFSLAAYFLYGQLFDWAETQTITTLESIATPIQQVQFPTVTVSPLDYLFQNIEMILLERTNGIGNYLVICLILV